MKQAIRIAIGSFLIAAAAIKAAPALASPAGSVTNVRLVSIGNLDLGTDSGQRALRHRLAQAARDVCGTASDADIEGKNEVRRCRAEALARARSDAQALRTGGRETVVAVRSRR